MSWMMRTVRLLSLFLPPDEAETVSGDLIEEYQDSILAAVGKRRADFWLARQVAGFIWRAPAVWALLVAACMAGRFAWDTFAPPDDYGARSFFTTWSAILIYLAAGAWAARRTGRARSGPVVAIASHLAGHFISVAVTGLLFVGVIRNEPARRLLFDQTGGWGEVWFLPLMLLPIVAFLGWLGGTFGRAMARRARA
jgi:hypothetical protein